MQRKKQEYETIFMAMDTAFSFIVQSKNSCNRPRQPAKHRKMFKFQYLFLEMCEGVQRCQWRHPRCEARRSLLKWSAIMHSLRSTAELRIKQAVINLTCLSCCRRVAKSIPELGGSVSKPTQQQSSNMASFTHSKTAPVSLGWSSECVLINVQKSQRFETLYKQFNKVQSSFQLLFIQHLLLKCLTNY